MELYRTDDHIVALGELRVASDATPHVSVIVPFRNPGQHFRPMLESLVDQQLEAPAEIILVDNRSTDRSREVANSIQGRVPIRIVDAPQRTNASYARNVGVRAALGAKLLFVDADDELAPGYLEAMTAALEDHNFVTSRVDSSTLNAPWVLDAHGPAWQADGLEVLYEFRIGTGVNVGLPRALFEQIGGFPEEFSGSQDIVFSWRAQDYGCTVHFVRDALYRYRYRNTLSRLFVQCCNWGSSNVLLYRHFVQEGMPSRTLRVALQEWRDVLRGILRSRNRTDLAPYVVRLGHCVGRFIGSLRYRRAYF